MFVEARQSDYKFYQRSNTRFKSNQIFYYTCCITLSLWGPISASLRPGNTAPFEEMSQRWRAVGNTVSDLTGPRLEL